jgi:hypothetical protein
MAPFPIFSEEGPRIVQTRDLEASEQRSIRYQHPSYSDEQVLRIADPETLGTALLVASATVRQLIFAEGLDVDE